MKLPPWPPMRGYRDIKLGLSRTYDLLARLGNPHEKLPPVIHVAGTNGKGSTIAFMRSILEAAGLRCHVYTSPHLVEFNERIVLAGKQIDDEYLTDICLRCERAAGDDLPVTFFEGTTVAAFLAFSEVDADIVLLETGMGGRLDTTNVVASPLATVITPIAMDHMEYLGNTIAKIAGEKAGIIKHGVPCIAAPQHKEAIVVLRAKAAEQHAPIIDDAAYRINDSTLFYRDHSIPIQELGLIGAHQEINAATACVALFSQEKFALPHTAIASGLKSAKWGARLQQLASPKLLDQLPDGSTFWLDGGHNEAAALAIRKQVNAWRNETTQPTLAILAMRQTKAHQDFLRELAGVFDAVYITSTPGDDGAINPSALYKHATQAGIEHCETTLDFWNAIEAITLRYQQPVNVIALGSLYFAGYILEQVE